MTVGDVVDDSYTAIRVSQAVRAHGVAIGVARFFAPGAAAGVLFFVAEVVVAVGLKIRTNEWEYLPLMLRSELTFCEYGLRLTTRY